MSLSYKIKLLPENEKTALINLLNKCLKIRSIWCKSLLSKSKTDNQCQFAYNKLMQAEKEFRTKFNYLNLDNFTLYDILFCSK